MCDFLRILDFQLAATGGTMLAPDTITSNKPVSCLIRIILLRIPKQPSKCRSGFPDLTPLN